MRPSFAFWALIASAMVHRCYGNYSITHDYTQESFFSDFTFFTDEDPTDGFVSYKSYDDAVHGKLLGYGDDSSVYIFSDSMNVTPEGRPSVRLESKQAYNHGLLVADIRHMPGNICGAWPALWMLGPTWPEDGEIDIVEGVNMQPDNAMTLHTSSGCAVDKQNKFLGEMATDNCAVHSPGQPENVGCSIAAPSMHATTNSSLRGTYGDAFNRLGGGVYAMEWTAHAISIWFWSHEGHTGNMSRMAALAPSPDPQTFGTPLARFAGADCAFDQRFRDLRIVIDTTFCGAWAGKVWATDGCAEQTGVATCDEYVRDNPEAFREAYWRFASLKWFERGNRSETNVTRRDAQLAPLFPNVTVDDAELRTRSVRTCRAQTPVVYDSAAPGVPRQPGCVIVGLAMAIVFWLA